MTRNQARLRPDHVCDSDTHPAGMPDALRRRLRHDLSGPLITARGFLDEIREVRTELAQWVEAHRAPLSAQGGESIERLLDDELDPCLDYLEKALAQLDERILSLSSTAADAPSDHPAA